jgi:lantibiotic modifying enzyme
MFVATQPKLQTWQPLLTGELRTAALATVAEIAEQLAVLPAPPASYRSDLALFFAYLARSAASVGDERLLAISAKHSADVQLEQAVDLLATTPLGVGLYGGLTGVGWSLAHLANWVYIADEADPNEVFDEVLSEAVGQTPWPGAFDLLGGLVGIGVYALERLPHPNGAALLAQVIDRLAEQTVVLPDGITWFTPAATLPAQQRQQFPHGYYNLGVAHGVPGVIALLGRAVAAGVATAPANQLLAGALRWLLAQEVQADPSRDDASALAGFPAWVTPVDRQPVSAGAGLVKTDKTARLAWCYGDLGIAAALLGVARRLDQAGWAATAQRLAQRAAQRSRVESGVRDGCLCHGAAGVAHLFNRLYQATGDPLLGRQARSWFTEALAQRQPDRGIAGYCFLRGELGWEASPGLLEGAAGIGLALLAACADHAPNWDRLLLVDMA